MSRAGEKPEGYGNCWTTVPYLSRADYGILHIARTREVDCTT